MFGVVVALQFAHLEGSMVLLNSNLLGKARRYLRDQVLLLPSGKEHGKIFVKLLLCVVGKPKKASLLTWRFLGKLDLIDGQRRQLSSAVNTVKRD